MEQKTPSPAQTRRWPRRPWRVAAFSLAILIALLCAALAGARFAANTDAGRNFITSLIDGSRAGPLGAIRLSGLSGDPLKAATARDLAFIDENGAWMRASNVELAWSPFDILFRRLDIERVHIDTVHVFRRPQVAPRESSGGGLPDFALRIGEATIDEIRIDDGVYGARASYRFAMSADIARDRAGDLNLDVTPLNGMGDHVGATASWTADTLTLARVSARGLAGGTLAALVQSPANQPVALTLEADGSTEDLKATASLSFGDQAVAEIRVNRTRRQGAAQGYLTLAGWPLLESLEQRIGERVEFAGTLDFTRPSRAPLEFDITAAAGHANGAGLLNLDRMNTRGPFQLDLHDIDLARQSDTIRSGRLSGQGEARIGGLIDWSWSGPVEITDFAAASVFAASLTGEVDLDLEDRGLAWRTDNTNADGFRIEGLSAFAVTNLRIASRGRYDLSDRIVTIADTNVTNGIGSTSVSGRYELNTGALDFSGVANAARLSAIAGLSGAASGDWSVKRAATSAAYEIGVDGNGQNLATSNASLSQLLGANPAIAAVATWHNGRLIVQNANVRTETISLDIDGQTAASGALSGTITGEVVQPLDFPGARLQALRINGELSGTTTSPIARINLSDGAATTSGVTLTDLAGLTIITNDDALALNASLTGAADGQPLEARFDLSRTDETFALSDVNISAGELVFAAPALTLEDGRAAGGFSLNGSLVGLYGFTAGGVNAQGRLATRDGAPLVTLNGELTNLRRPAVDLSRASFDATLQGDTLALNADLESRGATGPRLALDISGQRQGANWSGTASIDGEGGAQPISMATPASWSYGPDGYTVAGAASAFAGRIDADIISTTTSRRINLDLDQIDLRALTRLIQLSPAVGTATGSIALDAPYNAARTGALDLQLDNLNALGAETAPINVRLRGQLRNETLNLTATGSGGQFSIDGDARIQTVGEGLVIAPDQNAPVRANLDLNGRAEQFWAIARQSDQALSGALRLNFTAEGLLRAPSFDGGFSLTDGAYDHGESGFHIENINLRGDFNRRSLRLTSVTGQDRQGGQLKGEGRLDWSDTLSGSVDFEATNLRALNRDDRSVVLSGTGAVTVQPEAVLISGDMTVANARFSVEQPASAKIPTLTSVRRVNFPGREDTQTEEAPRRPIRLDLKVAAPRRVFVNGRGLDMEWATDFDVTGSIANPIVDGRATLLRGDLNLGGRRFPFDGGSITLNGPIRSARIDITATGSTSDADARVRLTGTPVDPQFVLESSPSLPQDEILSRLIFGRSAAELSALETAQLAAALAQLAGGQAAFDPSAILRGATGLDRISIGAEGDTASIAAGKYIAEDVFLQLGAGGEGGAAAEVEWEPADNLSVTSEARGNGDTRMTVRWKKDY